MSREQGDREQQLGDEITVSNGVMSHAASRKSTTFGKVAEAAAKLEPPTEVKLKDPKDWKIAGKALKRLDTPDKTTGKMTYGIDIKLPGMLNAAMRLNIPTVFVSGGPMEAGKTVASGPVAEHPHPRPELRREGLAREVVRLVQEARKNDGDPGTVLARRLSNAEYDYTIRDLTGVDIRPAQEFPVDPANQAGFDKQFGDFRDRSGDLRLHRHAVARLDPAAPVAGLTAPAERVP